MPLSKAGRKIKTNLEKQYGKKKGEQVFYAMENKGEIPGMKMGGMMDKKMGYMGGGMTKDKMGYKKGGMTKKSGYAKGGMVKANCGASMKPNRKAKK
jgi:hypothetical protein